MIFFSPPPFFLCLTERFCVTCLTGITPRWDIGLPPLYTLPSARSAILRLRAMLFINLADAITSSSLAHVHPVLGALHRLLPPLSSQHKHPSRSQPKLRLQRYHAVSGKQETIDAGSPASMAHLRALNRENSWIGSHLNEESLSLHLKTEQLRDFHGPKSRGNSTAACHR